MDASLSVGGGNPLRLSQDVAEIREGVGEVSSLFLYDSPPYINPKEHSLLSSLSSFLS